MLLSGLFTALFGLGYFWNIHVLWYFIVMQVRPCRRMARILPHPHVFLVFFEDGGGPVSKWEDIGHFHSPQNPAARGVGAETTGTPGSPSRAAGLATPTAPSSATATTQMALGLPQWGKKPKMSAFSTPLGFLSRGHALGMMSVLTGWCCRCLSPGVQRAGADDGLARCRGVRRELVREGKVSVSPACPPSSLSLLVMPTPVMPTLVLSPPGEV